MKNYTCFIFDFDNTLADSKLNITNSFNYALRTNSLKPISKYLIHPLIGKLNIQESFIKLYPDLSSETLNKLISDFKIYQRDHVNEIRLFNDVKKTLDSLCKTNKKLAIVTTKHIDQIMHITKALCINNYFEVIFGLGLKEYTKPQKECFSYIISKIGKQSCAMVGDSDVDCWFAKNSGIDMIGVSYGTDTAKKLKENGANYIINNLSELLWKNF